MRHSSEGRFYPPHRPVLEQPTGGHRGEVCRLREEVEHVLTTRLRDLRDVAAQFPARARVLAVSIRAHEVAAISVGYSGL